MIFTQTELKGAFVIDLEPRMDARGFFSRTFCQHEFADHGLKTIVAQCNLSFNHRKGTLRGLHYQLPPATEAKLIRCVLPVSAGMGFGGYLGARESMQITYTSIRVVDYHDQLELSPGSTLAPG